MAKRVRLTNETLNSYGTWIKTAGIDLALYEKNPILLYMHKRGDVIGTVDNLKIENDEITGELHFDEATELSTRLKKQYEAGSLRMVSVGIDIIELSEDPKLLKQGQTCPTVTKSRLNEVSLVDIGANEDAITLTHKGKALTLGKDGDNPLPQLSENFQKQKSYMELKQIALMLGLPETATNEQVTAKVKELLTLAKQVEALKKEKEQLTLSAITGVVETAIKERRLGADKKQQFVCLGEKIGVIELQKVMEAMNPATKVSDVLNINLSHEGSVYKKLGDVPADQIELLKNNDIAAYKRLYKAEYGMECKLN